LYDFARDRWISPRARGNDGDFSQGAGLIRALVETLRGGAEKAEALRSTLAKAVLNPEMRTAFDIFGSELPDEIFTGVFDQPRQRGWRRLDL